MTKLRLLQQLREAVTFGDSGQLKTGYGLICVHAGEDDADFDTFEETHVFVDHHAFIACIGELYDEHFSDGEELDLADLHDDPEVQKQIRDKTKQVPKLRGIDCETMDDLTKLDNWDGMCENVFIVDRF